MDKSRIEVRWLSFDADAQLDPCFLAALDDEERVQATKFRFAEDRATYIAAHALKRASLSSVYPLAANDWRFARSAHGKPFILQSHAASSLSFNLAHTRGFVAVALAHDMMIGIDVERIQIGKLDQELADRLFASIESEATRSLPPPAQIEALYKFWTLKEAFIKAIGLGLSLPLDAFAFTLEHLTISFDETVNEDATQWLFYSTRPSLDICMALAAKCQEPKAVSVNIQQVTIHDLERLLEDASN